jgi:alpha-glucoside transport system substrate-binding protein
VSGVNATTTTTTTTTRRRRRTVRLAWLAPVLAVALLFEGLWSVPPDTQRDTVTVLANWTDWEEDAFRNVLEEFEDETGIEVDYQGTRAVREVLLSQVQSGSPPDVAILSSLGELAEHQANGEILSLEEALDDPSVLDAYGEPWIPEIGRGEERGRYWVPVRVDVKSLVWYDAGRDDPARLALLAGDGDSWCAGMGSGATSGWPGTDWVEDLLLQQAGPEVYEAWATGDPDVWTGGAMADAWRSWRELLSGAGSARATEALTTDWDEAAARLIAEEGAGGEAEAEAEDGCSLNHMASVSRGHYDDPDTREREERRADFRPSAELLPGARSPGAPAWEVGGDFAAMFSETDEAAALIEFLAGAEAQRVWAEEAPDDLAPPLSAIAEVGADTYGRDEVSRDLSAALWGDDPRCLDASDAMPPAMRDAFHQAVLRFLASPGQDPDPMPFLEQLEEIRGEVEAAGGRWLPTVCRS